MPRRTPGRSQKTPPGSRPSPPGTRAGQDRPAQVAWPSRPRPRRAGPNPRPASRHRAAPARRPPAARAADAAPAICPPCQPTDPSSTSTRRTRTVQRRPAGVAGPAGPARCSGSNRQFATPAASRSSKMSGRTSARRCTSTTPSSSGSQARPASIRVARAMSGRVPPGRLASDTPSANSPSERPGRIEDRAGDGERSADPAFHRGGDARLERVLPQGEGGHAGRAQHQDHGQHD